MGLTKTQKQRLQDLYLVRVYWMAARPLLNLDEFFKEVQDAKIEVEIKDLERIQGRQG